MSEPMRIDVHHHMLPPDYVRWLSDQGITAAGGRAIPTWDVPSTLEMMDRHGIATGVLSVAAPGTHLGDASEAIAWARRVNEFGAELVRSRPDRFGLFATLPLPAVEGALSVAAQAFDELSADGVVLLANHRGVYLGDPVLDPVLELLNERSAVVFVHPNELPGPAVDGIPPYIADFLLDTTRAAANLVRHDVPRRYPNLKFILSHAGGFLPYAAHRIGLTIGELAGRNGLEVIEELAGFYFDTALSSTPAALPSLLAFAKPGHVLYGSDWPFVPEFAISYFNAGLDGYPGVDAEIDRTAAERLFPRLAS